MRIVAGVLLVVLAFLILDSCDITEAHHNEGGKLPGIPTPLIRNLYQDGEITWCTDSRATSYPQFVNQLRQTNDAASVRTGVPNRQVGFDSTCEVRHTMPDESFPAGVAGQIYYANWPVTVKYNWRLGYFDWKTTQGHEGTTCGHAMGEHEGYDDLRFVSYHNTYGGWASPWNAPTVMDFGTGVWECQASDVALVWSWLLPKAVKEAGIILESNPPTLYYCGASPLADRVAVMALSPWGEYIWTGNHLPASGGCVNLPLYSEPGWEFFFNSEIGPWAESWLWPSMRNDVSAGWAP